MHYILITKWYGIKQRCYNPKNTAYKYYGAKGVKMCDNWLKNITSFIEWSLNNGYKPNLDIDRIDPFGDYCPDNCRYITRRENLQNRRTSYLRKLFKKIPFK